MAIAARWGGKPTAGSREPMGGSKAKKPWLFDDSLGEYTTLHVFDMFFGLSSFLTWKSHSSSTSIVSLNMTFDII